MRLQHQNCHSKGDMLIINNVWIEQNATILSGVKTIMGARIVVRSYIPPYTIVVGNPAKIIKK